MRNLLWGYQIHPEQKYQRNSAHADIMTKPLLIGRGHHKDTFHNLSLMRLSGRVSGLAGLLVEYPLQLVRIGKQLVAFVHGKLHHTPTHM